MTTLSIKEIYQEDDRTLCIHWNTGQQLFYDVVELRRQCPCAICVDEQTGKRKLEPKNIPETTRPVKMNSVGSYALNITFDDGHRTGLYSYQKLANSGQTS